MKIHLLWCTCRPYVFTHTYSIWKNRMKGSDMATYVAVDSEEDAAIVKNSLSETDKVIVVKSDKRGVCYPSYMLSYQLEGEKDDIVVFASDDMIAPQNWDQSLRDRLRGREGALLIDDGYQSIDFSNMIDPIFSIPIMTYGTLLKLNKIIYNPVYTHLCSDSELYLNLKELGLIIDERAIDDFTIEHRHWSSGKRQADLNDQSYYNSFEKDKETWEKRKKLTLKERLYGN